MYVTWVIHQQLSGYKIKRNYTWGTRTKNVEYHYIGGTGHEAICFTDRYIRMSVTPCTSNVREQTICMIMSEFAFPVTQRCRTPRQQKQNNLPQTGSSTINRAPGCRRLQIENTNNVPTTECQNTQTPPPKKIQYNTGPLILTTHTGTKLTLY
jgi:hypothetical protein